MNEDGIGLVLAKTSELRSKITSCIQKAASKVGTDLKESEDLAGSESEENEEVETLLNIRDAFESLEGLLSSLQTLQQQQLYEKETTLTEIWYSQKKLLRELKEYKGKDLEVIHEAISFASETEENNDLLLPPYATRISHSAVINNDLLAFFPSTNKTAQNGGMSSGLKDLHNSQRDQGRSASRGPFDMLKALIGAATKTALTIVGVITILSVAGFEPRLRKRESQFNLLNLFQLQQNIEEMGVFKCPSGKVAKIENGEMRCVVRERVEVPFESLVATPDVNYGWG